MALRVAQETLVLPGALGGPSHPPPGKLSLFGVMATDARKQGHPLEPGLLPAVLSPERPQMWSLAAGACITAALAVLSDGPGKESSAWRRGTGRDDPRASRASCREHPLSPARAPADGEEQPGRACLCPMLPLRSLGLEGGFPAVSGWLPGEVPWVWNPGWGQDLGARLGASWAISQPLQGPRSQVSSVSGSLCTPGGLGPQTTPTLASPCFSVSESPQG